MSQCYQYLIFQDTKIIGYCPTWQEADDICKKHTHLTWDKKSNYLLYGDNKNTIVFENLKQLTIQSDIKNTDFLN